MRTLLAFLMAFSSTVMAEDKADIFHGENVFHYTVENGTELYINSDSGKTELVVFCDKPESIRAAIVLNMATEIDREKPSITVDTSNGQQGFETSVRTLSDGRNMLLIDPDNMRMVHFKSTRFIDAVANRDEIRIGMNLIEGGLNESFDMGEYSSGVSKVSAECRYQPK